MEAYPGREGQLDLVLWSERIRAVIAGDTLINLGNGLEIPASWLPDGVTVEEVATGLTPLLDKPVEIVLPTHGEPADRAALNTPSPDPCDHDAGTNMARTKRAQGVFTKAGASRRALVRGKPSVSRLRKGSRLARQDGSTVAGQGGVAIGPRR